MSRIRAKQQQQQERRARSMQLGGCDTPSFTVKSIVRKIPLLFVLGASLTVGVLQQINAVKQLRNAATTTTVSTTSGIHDGHFHKECFLIYAHFHKAGGTSMNDVMERQLSLAGIHQSTPAIVHGNDLSVNTSTADGLFISSTDNRVDSEHRAGKPEFWNNLKKRGPDFASLEFNFLTPQQFDNLADSCIQFWTVIRDPWRRFRSTYEKELQHELALTKGDIPKLVAKNCLEEWMKAGNLEKQFPRNNIRGGILYPNFYVRMLNGVNDQVTETPVMTEFHLERAKSVLRRFDLVVLLEDRIDALRRMKSFFNQTIVLPKHSNNKLKHRSFYDTVVAEANEQESLFEEQNVLDRKLYDFVKDELMKDVVH